MTDSPSSAALPAAEPGGSDPSADAATIAATARAAPTAASAAAAAAATPSAATGSDVTTKDYYAFRGETVKLLNHFGTVVTSIQQQISQAASLTEVSGRLAPENLGSVIAGQLQPALKKFSDIVTKSISAAMNPTAINTMVVAALAAQPPQVSAPAAAPTSSFYSFGQGLAPTNPIVQLPGYEVAPTAAPLTLASTSDAEMFLPKEAPQSTSLNKFWVGAAGLQACYDNWGYPWLFGCYKELQEESADRHQEVQALIRNLQADLPNKQAATPTLVMQPPSKSQSKVYHSTHPDIPFVPLVPASPVIGSVIAPATSSVLLPTMTSTANKSKIDQKIATFDKITQTSDVLSWLEDVSLACAITDIAHDKWVLVAGTHMTVTSYDDNSTTGVGSLSTSTKKQRTNSGTAQATGFSKMASCAALDPGQPSPEWLAREDRRILPHLFQKLQHLSGKTFTLDAAANDPGDNAHYAAWCSPSNSFMGKLHTGHVWINAPFT
ncbi:TPA: hypothetical protein ACH3X1_003086 [Trebouxia sp. C0004]